MNKVVLTFILVFALAFTVNAQIPQGMNYQAVLRDANGEIMSNTNVQLRFTIKRSFFDIAYQGEYYPSTNEFGMVNLTIGAFEDELNPNYGNFASIDWVSYYDWYLQVELWQNGAWLDLGSQIILTVPYAIHSETANKASNMSMDELIDVNYEELPVNGDQLIYSDYFGEWVPSSVAGALWHFNEPDVSYTTNQVGIGTDDPQTALAVHGFTQLGESAPKIKMKTLQASYSSDFGTGENTPVPHGIANVSKIISVSVIGIGYNTVTSLPTSFSYIIDDENITVNADSYEGGTVKVTIFYTP